MTGRNKKPNRTGRTEVNWTEPFNSGTGRNRTRKRTEPNRTEPNRTEPRRIRKAQAEQHRTGKTIDKPNRAETMTFRKLRNRNESNQIGSFLRIADLWTARLPEVLVVAIWRCAQSAKQILRSTELMSWGRGVWHQDDYRRDFRGPLLGAPSL